MRLDGRIIGAVWAGPKMAHCVPVGRFDRGEGAPGVDA